MTPLALSDGVLSAKRDRERAHIDEISNTHVGGGVVALVPWLGDPLATLGAAPAGGDACNPTEERT